MRTDFKESLRAIKRDKKLAPHIKKHGPFDLGRNHGKQRGIFHALLRSIVYQQISGKAAASILARVEALYPNDTPTPALTLKTPAGKLRAAGLSPQKVVYIKDLARKCLDETIDEKRFPKMTSEEIIEHLVQVKGIGVWTAHMLLIFTLHRSDILPVGDLGIRKGFQIVYRLRTLPDTKKMEQLARPWRPHATAASWYLWRVADSARPKPSAKEGAAKTHAKRS
jgi:DNA-3-methyladenine glycosylase II